MAGNGQKGNQGNQPRTVTGTAPDTSQFAPGLENVPGQAMELAATEADSLIHNWSGDFDLSTLPLLDGLTGEEYNPELVKAVFGLDQDAAKWASYTAHGFLEPLNGNVLLGFLSSIREMPSTFTSGKMRKVGMVEGLAWRYSKPDARAWTKAKKDPVFNPANFRLEGGVYSLGEITALQKMGAAENRIICVRFGPYVGESITKKHAIFQVASEEQTKAFLPRLISSNLVAKSALDKIGR